MADFNLFSTPDYYGGLLGEEAVNKLQRQATGTAITNALIGYLAQPKNQRYGSALPYLGKALAAGYQSGQDVIAGGLRDYETKQKIEELARQKKAREQFDIASSNLYKTVPAQMETVTTPGGYAPAQTDIQAGQVSPNFGMTKLPDVTTQREVAPARQELNQQALQQMMLSGDPRAASYLSGLKTLKELTTPDLVKLGRGEVAYDITSGKSVAKGLPEQVKPKDYGNDLEAQASADFGGKSFGELTPIQQQSVITKVDARAQSKAPKVSVNLSDPTAKAKVAIDLSERAAKFYKDDIDTANQYAIIKNLAQNPTPTGDTTLLYSLFKVLDPTSTVREGEVNMVMQSRSIPSQLKGYAQRLSGGGTLLPKERQEILSIAEQRVNVRKANVDKTRKAFVDNAKRFELDPDIYVPNPYAESGKKGNVEVDY